MVRVYIVDILVFGDDGWFVEVIVVLSLPFYVYLINRPFMEYTKDIMPTFGQWSTLSYETTVSIL